MFILPRFLIIITVSGATTSGILSESWHEVLVESVSGTCKLTGLVLFVKFSEISGGKMIDSDCDVDGSANAVVPGGDAVSSVVLLTAVTIKFYWTYWIKQLHEISGYYDSGAHGNLYDDKTMMFYRWLEWFIILKITIER